MNPHNFFSSVPSVSKSLLIVLGTLPNLTLSKAITPALDLFLFFYTVTDCAYGWPLGMTLRRVPRYKIGNSFRLSFTFRSGKVAKVISTSRRAHVSPGGARHLRSVRADPMRRDSSSDKIRVIHPSVKGNIR
jgi:hypothetical protein